MLHASHPPAAMGMANSLATPPTTGEVRPFKNLFKKGIDNVILRQRVLGGLTLTSLVDQVTIDHQDIRDAERASRNIPRDSPKAASLREHIKYFEDRDRLEDKRPKTSLSKYERAARACKVFEGHYTQALQYKKAGIEVHPDSFVEKFFLKESGPLGKEYLDICNKASKDANNEALELVLSFLDSMGLVDCEAYRRSKDGAAKGISLANGHQHDASNEVSTIGRATASPSTSTSTSVSASTPASTSTPGPSQLHISQKPGTEKTQLHNSDKPEGDATPAAVAEAQLSHTSGQQLPEGVPAMGSPGHEHQQPLVQNSPEVEALVPRRIEEQEVQVLPNPEDSMLQLQSDGQPQAIATAQLDEKDFESKPAFQQQPRSNLIPSGMSFAAKPSGPTLSIERRNDEPGVEKVVPQPIKSATWPYERSSIKRKASNVSIVQLAGGDPGELLKDYVSGEAKVWGEKW